MKIKLATLTATMLMAFGASSAFAGCASKNCVDKIEKLYITQNTVLVDTEGTETALDPSYCVPHSGVYIRLLNSHGNFDAIYSLLLAAQFNDKTVSIRVSPDTASLDPASGKPRCKINYVTHSS